MCPHDALHTGRGDQRRLIVPFCGTFDSGWGIAVRGICLWAHSIQNVRTVSIPRSFRAMSTASRAVVASAPENMYPRITMRRIIRRMGAPSRAPIPRNKSTVTGRAMPNIRTSGEFAKSSKLIAAWIFANQSYHSRLAGAGLRPEKDRTTFWAANRIDRPLQIVVAVAAIHSLLRCWKVAQSPPQHNSGNQACKDRYTHRRNEPPRPPKKHR